MADDIGVQDAVLNLTVDGLSASKIHVTAERLGVVLQKQGYFLALAESCTGGGVATAVTEIPGASVWFESGLVVYANRAKQTLLNVPEALIKQQGAVSEAVVRAMVSGLFERTNAQVAAAVSGVAGPGGGSNEKPVGTVWFGFGLRKDMQHTVLLAERQCFTGDRHQVRMQAIQYCLSRLLSVAQGDVGEA